MMNFKESLKSSILLFFLACTISAQGSATVYNVKDYGAVADGKTDSTEGFQKAWGEACAADGGAAFLIPEGTFLVGPVIFNGPCSGSVEVQLKGKVLAPTDLSIFKNNWIEFQKINGLTVTGGGIIDGQGASAWPKNTNAKTSEIKCLPMSLVFASVENSTIESISVVNSKFFHLNMFDSKNLHFDNIIINSPGDSPNTDGIHMGDVSNINITNTKISAGDDCISIGPGSVDVTITNVKCGPGHGISVGSLGKYQNEKDVSGLTIKNCTLTGTSNGVRVKSWQDNPSALVASDIVFDGITMNDVYNPIVIDQKYCPHGQCSTQSSSKVKIQQVAFRNINGTSASPEAISLVCSDANPCEGIELTNINLDCNGGGSNTTCINAKGTSDGSMNTTSCLS